MALYTLVFFLAYDFGRYLAHFVQHRFDILWHFHKVHHSAEVLTPFTAFRAHPVDLVIMATFPAAATGMVNGIFNYWSGGTAGLHLFFGLHAFIFIYNLVGNLRHTHVWLSYGPVLSQIFISPAQHQIHHSIEERHWGRNIGFALAIWDRLFATLYIPRSTNNSPSAWAMGPKGAITASSGCIGSRSGTCSGGTTTTMACRVGTVDPPACLGNNRAAKNRKSMALKHETNFLRGTAHGQPASGQLPGRHP
jgi:hypothetical protein